MHLNWLMPLGGVLQGTLPNPDLSSQMFIQSQVFGRRSFNANLTGPITSTGNATAVAAQTGTGSTFAMQAVPSFSTTIGVGAATASASGAGITFPATQSASTNANTLDDYEEGTWTPVFTFVTVGDLSVVYTTQVGTYTKIGDCVHTTFALAFTPTFTTSAGQSRISGYPFTAPSNSTAPNGALRFDGVTAAGYTDFSAQMVAGSSEANFNACATALARTTLSSANYTTATSTTHYSSVTYKV